MRYRSMVISLLFLACISCSSSEEPEHQPPRETAQEAIGHKAAEQMKATLDSAEKARRIEEDRLRQTQEMVEQQEKSQ